MNFVLFDGKLWVNLLPITYSKPIADIRVGILTIREKWEKYLKSKPSTLTQEYLSKKFPLVKSDENMMINSSFCPNEALVESILSLKQGQILVKKNETIAFYTQNIECSQIDKYERIEFKKPTIQIKNLADIFLYNHVLLLSDFNLLTKDKTSATLSNTNNIINENDIFLEENTEVEYTTLNAKDAPIYIGRDSKIMEGCTIRGGLALCKNAVLKMGTKIYGATTIGIKSVVAGEIKNSIIGNYSNKGHDGYLGNSIIGDWCNLGANTNISNLKNTLSDIKIWSISQKGYLNSKQQSFGIAMGDYCKTGVNTMFNSGSIVGVNCNIFGHGFQNKYIPSFSWTDGKHTVRYNTKKALEVSAKTMEMKEKIMTKEEREILYHLTKLVV